MTAASLPGAGHVLTLDELDANPWASCGPAALAALLGRPLAEIRDAFSNQREGRTWTNLRQMREALWGLRCGFKCAEFRAADSPLRWPGRGLVIVQFRGSWDSMPVHHPAQLQRSHWIAVKPADREPAIFDVNLVDPESPTPDGWVPRAVWEEQVVPWLAAGFGKKATGAWWVRAGIEVR